MDNQDIKALVINLLATAIVGFIGWVRKNTKGENSKNNGSKYSKRDISKLKLEFYIPLAITAALIVLPEPKLEFLQTVKRVISMISLTLMVFSFACLIDLVRDNPSEEVPDDAAEKNNEIEHSNTPLSQNLFENRAANERTDEAANGKFKE